MLKRSDFTIKFTGFLQWNKSIMGVYHPNIIEALYANINISECEKFIESKIRESLKFPKSASEFFSYKNFFF